jgi:hypothetical protein
MSPQIAQMKHFAGRCLSFLQRRDYLVTGLTFPAAEVNLAVGLLPGHGHRAK